MSTGTVTSTELNLWKEVASSFLSPSHDRWHIDLVLHYAKQLQEIHGGDSDILMAAIILHDLGRTDPSQHGDESIEKSLPIVRKILSRIDIPKEKVESVVKVIMEHDKPNITPTTIEGKILKDADFLAGFGAWGVIRVAMWAGETQGGVPQILDRLENRMLVRVKNLEFPESENWARKEMLFSNLVLSYLKGVQNRELNKRQGKYIILEGISGSGKDTQAELLRNRLGELGFEVKLVSEPSDIYNRVRNLWEKEYNESFDDPILRRFVLIADRYKLIKEVVNPSLEKGDLVISTRSLISFLVYQCFEESQQIYSETDFAEMAYIHHFVPVPDIIVLFDVEPEVALNRIKERKKARSRYEKLELLKIHRDKYLSIVNGGLFGRHFIVIDANRTVDLIAADTWKSIERMLPSIVDRSDI